ncbi:MAG TPA: NINE protein [Pyrinomonadaceae bacterium]|nr:NINE protein [Pyrinomonadaceae bacterium]
MTRYCTKCGATNDETAQYCIACQAPLAPATGGYQPMQSVNQQQQMVDWKTLGADKKLVAGICGILLGGFGVHKFILGYTTEGIIQIVITLVTCGAGGIIGIIEGIIYLTKSDEDFVRTYIQGKKGWF